MPHRSETIRHSRRLTAVALLALAAALCAGVWARDHTAAVSPPITLAADQARAVGFLLDGRPQAPAPLFLFTDPNKDPDDLSVLVLASDLQEQGFVDLRCVVTTLGDRETRLRRARFAKDVLEDLGLSGVKVGVGGDYGFEVKDAEGKPDLEATEGRRKDHQVFIDSRFGQPRGAVATDGLALLESELAQVPDGSAVLLVNAGMADLAALLRDAPELGEAQDRQGRDHGRRRPQVRRARLGQRRRARLQQHDRPALGRLRLRAAAGARHSAGRGHQGGRLRRGCPARLLRGHGRHRASDRRLSQGPAEAVAAGRSGRASNRATCPRR